VPASSSSAEEWDSSDKLAAVIQASGLNGADLCTYCRERGLYPQQLAGWRPPLPAKLSPLLIESLGA